MNFYFSGFVIKISADRENVRCTTQCCMSVPSFKTALYQWNKKLSLSLLLDVVCFWGVGVRVGVCRRDGKGGGSLVSASVLLVRSYLTCTSLRGMFFPLLIW